MLLHLALLVACSDKDTADSGATDDSSAQNVDSGVVPDSDGDGSPDDVDCEPEDASIHPDADELCNGVDDNCDEVIDDDAIDQGTWYPDKDGDGFGIDAPYEACDGGDDAEAGGDCDDDLDTVYPGAAEQCGDGVVNDCDSSAEEARLECRPGWGTEGYSVAGSASGETLGVSVHSGGDLDGDGQADVVIGAPLMNENYRGAAYVFTSARSGTVDASAADAIIAPTPSRGQAGASVEIIPDLNGDNIDELLVGAPADTSAESAGNAYLFLGPIESSDEESAHASMYGRFDGDYFGWAVGSAGDVDGDGEGDLLVGTPYQQDEGTAGRAYLFMGPVSGSLSEESARHFYRYNNDQVGQAVEGLGDVNGDGLDDILVTAPNVDVNEGNRSGAAYVFFGPATSTGSLNNADVRFEGEESQTSGRFGYAAARIGDADGDGNEDVLIGAPYVDEGNGATYLYVGVTEGELQTGDASATLTGEDGQNSGFSLASGGDVDGDGLNEILVGTPYSSDESANGNFYRIYGGVSGTSTLNSHGSYLIGTYSYGWSVAGGTDLNNDGLLDFVVGRPYASGGGHATITTSGDAY